MKILYDHQIFEYQKTGGISRYFTELINHFGDEIEYKLAIKYSDNEYVSKSKRYSVLPIIDYRKEFLKGIEFYGKGKLFNYASRLFPQKYPVYYLENLENSIDELKKQEFDVFHPTFYNSYFLDFIDKKPFVITIHDLTYEIFPEFANVRDWGYLNMQDLARKASHIIAISENTKKDIIKFYSIDENKISVIYHGVDLPKSKTPSKIINGNYLLYIGGRNGYKNFLFFVRSISSILKKKEINILCIGNEFTKEEIGLFNQLDIENRMFTYFANDDQMADLYSNAIALVFPSLYEGFGMPIIEAFSCNCPVVLANTSCFPEIAGEAGLYFNPKNNIEIVEKVNSVINDEQMRQELINKGRNQLKHFSWENAANETIKVYNNVINK